MDRLVPGGKSGPQQLWSPSQRQARIRLPPRARSLVYKMRTSTNVCAQTARRPSAGLRLGKATSGLGPLLCRARALARAHARPQANARPPAHPPPRARAQRRPCMRARARTHGAAENVECGQNVECGRPRPAEPPAWAPGLGVLVGAMRMGTSDGLIGQEGGGSEDSRPRRPGLQFSTPLHSLSLSLSLSLSFCLSLSPSLSLPLSGSLSLSLTHSGGHCGGRTAGVPGPQSDGVLSAGAAAEAQPDAPLPPPVACGPARGRGCSAARRDRRRPSA